LPTNDEIFMTTIRAAALIFLVFGVTAASAFARVDAKPVPRLIFPVVGKATYINDFGAPRGNGGHQGNDLMTTWRSPAVAVEAGKVKFHTTSARAGCMLYLYGASGTTYLYIHLNNDLTASNDNRGKCVAGSAYWKGLKDGARVQAGQPIAYNGNSGDADQAGYHLHFEVHPGGGGAVSPFTHLRRAKKLLFAVQPGADFTAALRGSVVHADATTQSLTLLVDRVQSWPGGVRVNDVKRSVELTVPPTTTIFDPLGALIAGARIAALKKGQSAVAWTEKAPASLEAALGEPGALTTERLVLR
jgi:murein DD-endopeptidase MepM/ murein hydrolase activator NlpD